MLSHAVLQQHKKRDGDGFELSIEEMETGAREALALGITGCIVGGLHPSLPFSYYTDMLRALKAVDSNLQLKCFTAVEFIISHVKANCRCPRCSQP